MMPELMIYNILTINEKPNYKFKYNIIIFYTFIIKWIYSSFCFVQLILHHL